MRKPPTTETAVLSWFTPVTAVDLFREQDYIFVLTGENDAMPLERREVLRGHQARGHAQEQEEYECRAAQAAFWERPGL